MAITRDADFPAATAELYMAFSHCAEGHDTREVLEAAANFFVAALGVHSRATGGDLAFAMRLAEHFGGRLPSEIEMQWNRQPQATDIPVPSAGN